MGSGNFINTRVVRKPKTMPQQIISMTKKNTHTLGKLCIKRRKIRRIKRRKITKIRLPKMKKTGNNLKKILQNLLTMLF